MISRKLRVAVYSADGRGIETLDEDLAKQKNLIILPDLFLYDLQDNSDPNAPVFRELSDGRRGPLFCPGCKQHTLWVKSMGYWD